MNLHFLTEIIFAVLDRNCPFTVKMLAGDTTQDFDADSSEETNDKTQANVKVVS